MVGKLLSLDLKEHGVIVSIVHPGFMRTEMTAGVGFDKFWDDGGAVLPEEAARSLRAWVEGLDMSKSGQYWAPRGPRMSPGRISCLMSSLLIMDRRYRDGGGDDWERSSHPVAVAVVAASRCMFKVHSDKANGYSDQALRFRLRSLQYSFLH